MRYLIFILLLTGCLDNLFGHNINIKGGNEKIEQNVFLQKTRLNKSSAPTDLLKYISMPKDKRKEKELDKILKEPSVFILLLNEKGANIKEPGKDGETNRPFTYIACRYNDEKTLLKLLDKGAELICSASDEPKNIRNDGKTLLHVAALNGASRVAINVLLKKDSKTKNWIVDPMIYDKNGLLAIHYAARGERSEHIDILKEIIRFTKEANPFSKEGINGLLVTPLFLAAKKGATANCREIAKFLVTIVDSVEELIVAKSSDGSTIVKAIDLGENLNNPEITLAIFPYMARNENVISIFKGLKELGQGAFGTVSKVKVSLGNKEHFFAAAKEIDSVDLSAKEVRKIYEEINIMAKLNKSEPDNNRGLEYILQYYGFVEEKQLSDGELNNEKLNRVFIITELAKGGSLEKYVDDNKSKPNYDKLIKYMSDAAKGLEFLARRHFVHRDVAERNILIIKGKESGRAIISDFGTAREGTFDKYHEVGYKQRSPAELDVGCTPWEALDRDRSKRIFNEKTDVWSYGVMAYRVGILHKYIHFEKFRNEEKKFNVLKFHEEIKNSDNHPMNYLTKANEIQNNILRGLVEKCLMKMQEDRPTFSDIIEYIENGGN